MLPPAPGRFSITIGWPHRRERSALMSRVMMSVVPPGEKPISTFTSRCGHCARAASEKSNSPASSARMG
jgi:hypothetical protein